MDSVQLLDDPRERVQVDLRPATVDDLAYVFRTWLETFRPADAVKRVHRGLYDSRQHETIARLLARSRVIVARGVGMDQISGWLVHEGHTLHYAYVRADRRHAGIARALLAAMPRPNRYTHRTEDGCRLLARSGALYDPWGIV